MVTMTDAAKIRLAETPPTHCSSCFAQHPQFRHVDFGAVWDGPTFARGDQEVVGGAPLSIDDLVVCEECVRAAATVLDLTDEDTRRHVLEMEAQVEDLRERLHGAMAYIERVEQAEKARDTLGELLAGKGD